ncbi:MAG: hypothetical protein IJK55_04850 [Bacteroidales bacterium]|nr:hypothetical protein [Bacteroidales bacterium]
MKRNIWIVILMTIVVDFFFFDFRFRFFPIANTKMMLAVVGLLAFAFKSFQDRTVHISRRVFISAALAVLFSLWCYFAIVANGSYEREFIHYYASFATWLGGAYGVYVILKTQYERVDLRLLTFFLAYACSAQCILALLIDNVAPIHDFVHSTIWQASQMYERAGRLYGIGCALDPAGIRFSAVQVMIAHQLAMEDRVREDVRQSGILIAAFLLITVVGSIISRTTVVGTVLGLVYIVYGNLRMQRGGVISKIQVNTSLLLLFLLGAAFLISMIFYNSSASFHEDLRFGFEGFFNWVETGEFRTGSTDQLKQMWVWPTTPRGWIIGEGRIGIFQTNSDIGYCNYIIYCGLIGMAIFSIYFLHNHLSLIGKFRNFTLAALLLVALTFIVWTKVLTDIFLLDALLFCIDGDIDESGKKE